MGRRWWDPCSHGFDVNIESDPTNGIHGTIDNRSELEAEDPDRAAFIARYFNAERRVPAR